MLPFLVGAAGLCSAAFFGIVSQLWATLTVFVYSTGGLTEWKDSYLLDYVIVTWWNHGGKKASNLEHPIKMVTFWLSYVIWKNCFSAWISATPKTPGHVFGECQSNSWVRFEGTIALTFALLQFFQETGHHISESVSANWILNTFFWSFRPTTSSECFARRHASACQMKMVRNPPDRTPQTSSV